MIFLFLSSIHLYWAFGGKWGKDAAIEEKILHIPIPLFVSKYGLGIIAAIFLIRAIGEFKYVGFFKKVKHTKFWQSDTRYYSPLCLGIGVLTIILQLMK